MTERLSGHQQMEENAAESIAASQAARQVTDRAIADNAKFDTGESVHAKANVLNRQIDQGAVMAEKIDDIESRRMSVEARRTSPGVQAMNQAAEMEIFGSRGRTQGYVDAEGKPLTEPISGIVDRIRGISEADEIRKNPRYGTEESDRNAAADAYEAQFKAGQAERDARADGIVESIDGLQAEGFELSQAKLIHDLAGEVGAKQHALFNKLAAQAAGGKELSAEEGQRIKSEAVGRVIVRTVHDGDDLGMLKRVIKNEGLFNRDEYNKFRFKRGNEKNGERREFKPYREQSVEDLRNHKDTANRQALINELNAKTIRRGQMHVRKDEAEHESQDSGEVKEPITGVMPEQPEPPKPDENGGWAKFKRGVWKHLHEAPVDMTPMGAPIQPDKPFEEWYKEEGHKESQKRRRTIAAIGALAAAGIIALGLASKTEEGTTGVPVHPHQNTPAKKGAAKLPGTPEAKTAVRMKPGDNPWTESEDILQARGNAHPTPAQIEELDKQMAELNPDKYSYSGTSSEHMPVGTELKVPKP